MAKSLTEFLFARISETQIRVFDGINRRAGGAEWRDIELLRMCSAMRQVVAASSTDFIGGAIESRELRAIAAAYSDHPDYQRAWTA